MILHARDHVVKKDISLATVISNWNVSANEFVNVYMYTRKWLDENNGVSFSEIVNWLWRK